MPKAVIKGCGVYLPQKVLTNRELEQLVDTSDEWIRERTGIIERRVGAENEQTSDLATHAGENALKDAGIAVGDVDLIIVATTTPDNTFPATATRVQAMLGMTRGAAFDIQAACTGFVYALSMADAFIRTGAFRTILVIGADMLTRIVDWTDRNTCILFGDGAGAVVLQAAEEGARGILSSAIHSDGRTRDLLFVDGGASSTGAAGVIKMYGQEVFKLAIEKMASCTEEALDKAGLGVRDVTWMVPHQANLRIMTASVKKLGIPLHKLVSTVDRHGNTSAASIPLALHVAREDGRIKEGDVVAMQAVGGGLTWGAVILRW